MIEILRCIRSGPHKEMSNIGQLGGYLVWWKVWLFIGVALSAVYSGEILIEQYGGVWTAFGLFFGGVWFGYLVDEYLVDEKMNMREP